MEGRLPSISRSTAYLALGELYTQRMTFPGRRGSKGRRSPHSVISRRNKPAQGQPHQPLPPLISLTSHILQHGEVIIAWNYLFTWNEHCLSADDFEPCVDLREHRLQSTDGSSSSNDIRLRNTLDPLCDDALAVLYPDPNQSVGHDLLETLLRLIPP
jgi:hypothetical protein